MPAALILALVNFLLHLSIAAIAIWESIHEQPPDDLGVRLGAWSPFLVALMVPSIVVSVSAWNQRKTKNKNSAFPIAAIAILCSAIALSALYFMVFQATGLHPFICLLIFAIEGSIVGYTIFRSSKQ